MSIHPSQAMLLNCHLFSILLKTMFAHKKSYNLLILPLCSGAILSSTGTPMGNQQSKEKGTVLRRNVRSVMWPWLKTCWLAVYHYFWDWLMYNRQYISCQCNYSYWVSLWGSAIWYQCSASALVTHHSWVVYYCLFVTNILVLWTISIINISTV